MKHQKKWLILLLIGTRNNLNLQGGGDAPAAKLRRINAAEEAASITVSAKIPTPSIVNPAKTPKLRRVDTDSQATLALAIPTLHDNPQIAPSAAEIKKLIAREKKRVHNAQYSKAHPDKRKAQKAKYRATHKAKDHAYIAQYRIKNKDAIKAQRAEYRARQKAAIALLDLVDDKPETGAAADEPAVASI